MKITLWKPVFPVMALFVLLSGNVQALPYFVGASIYDAHASGAQRLAGFRYSTNSGDPGSAQLPLDFVGDSPDAGFVGRDITFELQLGDNIFEFDRAKSTWPVSFYGLNLFFNTTGTPLVSTVDEIGDLVVASQNNTVPFFTPVAGTQVSSYGTNALNTLPYNGDTLQSLGLFDISVTGFDIGETSTNVLGSITINVVQRGSPPTPSVPVPATYLLFGIGFVAIRFFHKMA
jgi:hypothetical protein